MYSYYVVLLSNDWICLLNKRGRKRGTHGAREGGKEKEKNRRKEGRQVGKREGRERKKNLIYLISVL